MEVKGFSTDNNRFSNFECYQLNLSSSGAPSLEIGVDRQYSITSMARNFGTNIEVGTNSIGIPIYKYVSLEFSLFESTSGLSSFLSSSLSQRASDSFVYAAIYNFPTNQYTTSSFGEDILTPIGRTHYNEWLSRNNSQDPYFRQVCGDKLVVSEEKYAAVYYTMNMEYSSLFSSSRISSSSGVSIGLLDFSSSVYSSMSTGSVAGSLSMRAHQVGGDLVEFTTQVSSSLSCSNNSINTCENLSQSWQNYASLFVSSVESDGNSVTRGNPVLSSISSFGLDPGVSQLTPTIISARGQIENIYDTNKKYVGILEGYQRFIESTPGMSSSFETKVNTLLSTITNNLDIIENNFDGAVQCYDSPTDCPTVLAGINSRVTELTPSLLNLYDNSFRHYYSNFFGCDGANLIPNGQGGWVLDARTSCTMHLHSHVQRKCSDSSNYGCNDQGSVVAELVDFSASRVEEDLICGILSYKHNNNLMRTGVRCESESNQDTLHCSGNLKMFEETKHAPINAKAECIYFSGSPGTTNKQNNPYYISDFDGGGSSDIDGTCPGLSDYSGCTGLSSAAIVGITVGVVVFGFCAFEYFYYNH